jgi:hypothetical protein
LATAALAAEPADEASPAGANTDAQGIELFEQKIRPVLVERCYQCHSADAEEIQSNLVLDSRESVRRGGDTAPAVVPGKPEESLLLEAIRYQGLEMPPDGKLPDRVIADFERWIALGAPDPRDESTSATERPAIDVEAGKSHWAFQPPERHEPPAVQNAAWVQRPIDAFLLARLEEAGLEPSPVADRRTLIRRVTFDLIGLPPTPQEVDDFVNDASPDAYERVVARLLDSPHYGERWARLWLDIARYAEDQAHIVGDDKSLFYPNAYLYRDWVIEAFNHDMPYDLFLRLQLAADLMEDRSEADQVALGFIGLGPKYYSRRSKEVMAEEWSDRVDTVTRGLLGLTVACARCHDHKYDPIPTEDYYALAGVFASTEMFNKPLDDQREKKDNGQAEKPEDSLHIVRDDDKPVDLHVFVRGNVKQEGPLAPRHFLHVLADDEPQPLQNGSGRLDLAEAIADPENPLTARVIVNRIWGQNFGRPLVGTPSNFGKLGDEPTHPELLDDLAVRFIESGWSLKWLQKEIVLSAAYRQQSHERADQRKVDPTNRLLGRMNRKRLDVERWRDAMLSASGRLEAAVGGESIRPDDPDARRRTVYSHVSRLDLNSMLAKFDFPDPNAHAARRNLTTTPLQKLFVLNHPLMDQLATALARRVCDTCDAHGERIDRAYMLLYSRPASDQERALGLEYLQADSNDEDARQRWVQYAQVLLAANETLVLD